MTLLLGAPVPPVETLEGMYLAFFLVSAGIIVLLGVGGLVVCLLSSTSSSNSNSNSNSNSKKKNQLLSDYE